MSEQGAQASAVVMVSGGLDSATVLAMAQAQGYRCYALSFDYGQRHGAELDAARRIAARLGAVEHRVLHLDLGGFGGSALTDPSIAVPEAPTVGIPVTYVPARNILFLAHALAWAEVLEARAIFLGINAVDYSGYPDCRPEFVRAFQQLIDCGTRAGVDGTGPRVEAPLLHRTKAEIIQRGTELGVDYAETVSCYTADGQGRACGRCDSCRLRAAGFAGAGVQDPTRYR